MPRAEDIRIAKNTVIIYVRMAVTILVGLITSRLVLQALGASDVGIYSVVGSTVALVSFITASLTATTVRFMNFELGKRGGDPNRIFNICHVVHIAGALVILVLLETIGIWYINTYLNVPPGREADAMFVFQVSTIVACLGIANVPFQGLFTVHEKFSTVALIDIINALVKLGLVLLLLLYAGNGLRMYAVMMSVTTWLSFIVYHALGRRRWRETVRWKPVWKREAYKEILVFNNYTLLSSAALVGRSQGSNMLLNLFFGPAMNAAFYYAGMVQNYVNQFIANFDTASAPQITQNVGAGNPGRSVELAARVGRICLLLLLLLLLPIWSELPFLMKLWLGEKIPDGTILLCRYTLIVAAVGATSAGLTQLINAYGRIKWFKIESSVLFLLCLPAGYFLFKGGAPAQSIILCYIIADLHNRIIQFALLKFQEGLRLRSYFKEAYLRPAIVALVLAGYLALYRLAAPEGLGWKLLSLAVTIAVSSAVIFFIGLKKQERKTVTRTLSRWRDRFLMRHCYRCYMDMRWKQKFGGRIDWKHPRDLNEKIQWLMVYGDTSAWTRLADKLAVRDYLREKGLENLSVPLLGSWERASEIPFDELPERFVLKCSHDSGSAVVVTPQSDRAAICAALDRALGVHYGYVHGELFYNGIPPRIVAEEYIGDGTPPVDYKVWCFDGQPYAVWTCSNRSAEGVDAGLYDPDWNFHPENMVDDGHYRIGAPIPRPDCLESMLSAAATLSEGFPEVRVDFYIAGGRLYFGEMTFTSLEGRMTFYTPEYLRELGAKVRIPE